MNCLSWSVFESSQLVFLFALFSSAARVICCSPARSALRISAQSGAQELTTWTYTRANESLPIAQDNSDGLSMEFRRIRWLGHVLRVDQVRIPKVALRWTASGKRKHGRPKTTWRRTVMAELSEVKNSHGARHSMLHKVGINGGGLLLPYPYVPQGTKKIK